MRPYERVLIQYDYYPYKKKKMPYEDRDTQEECHVTGRQRLECVAASQGKPRIAGHHQKLGKGKDEPYPESQREHGFANTLVLEL